MSTGSPTLIVASDLDSTLIHGGRPPSVEVIRAVRDLVGWPEIRFVLATSRSPRCVRAWFEPFLTRMDVVCCNGAIWLQRGGVRWSRPLTPGLVAQTIRLLDLFGAEYALDYGHSFVANSRSSLPWMGTRHRRVVPRRVPTGLDGVLKICVARADLAHEALGALRGIKLLAHCSGDLDVVAAGNDKSLPLRIMKEIDHGSRARLVAFGDDENDRGMLTAADRGFVVGDRMADLDGVLGIRRIRTDEVTSALHQLAWERQLVGAS